jgi:hypothetical protein
MTKSPASRRGFCVPAFQIRSLPFCGPAGWEYGKFQRTSGAHVEIVKIRIGTARRVGPFFIRQKRSREKPMQLTAIGLATALALASTTAFAMGGGGGGGGAGAGAGAGWSYTRNPADCGGLVCFAKSPSALTAPNLRRKRSRAHTAHR